MPPTIDDVTCVVSAPKVVTSHVLCPTSGDVMHTGVGCDVMHTGVGCVVCQSGGCPADYTQELTAKGRNSAARVLGH